MQSQISILLIQHFFLSFIHSFFFLTSCLEVRRVRVDNGLSTQCHFSLVLLFFIPYCCSAPGLHPNPFLSSWICLNWMMSSIFDAPTARWWIKRLQFVLPAPDTSPIWTYFPLKETKPAVKMSLCRLMCQRFEQHLLFVITAVCLLLIWLINLFEFY